jgi:hypothetical protein
VTPSALLLIGCSRRKARGVAAGRAWDVYDGRLFQVLKKALRGVEGWERQIDVLIVSARYGVIRAHELIEAYDARMKVECAGRPEEFWSGALRRAIRRRCYRTVHVNLGGDYLRVLPRVGELFGGAKVEMAHGGIGQRNAQTRRWVLDSLRATDEPSGASEG